MKPCTFMEPCKGHLYWSPSWSPAKDPSLVLLRPASSSQALSQRLEHVSTIEPCLTDWSMSQGEKIYTLTICLFTDIQYFLFPIFVRIDIPYFWQDIPKMLFCIFIFYFLVYLRINNPKNWLKIAKKSIHILKKGAPQKGPWYPFAIKRETPI